MSPPRSYCLTDRGNGRLGRPSRRGAGVAVLTDVLEWLQALPQPALVGATGALVFAECTIGLGFIAPGEGGLLIAATTVDSVQRFLLLWIVVTVCAGLGDSIGFAIGRRFGPRLRETKPLQKYGSEGSEKTTGVVRRRGAAGGGVLAGDACRERRRARRGGEGNRGHDHDGRHVRGDRPRGGRRRDRAGAQAPQGTARVGRPGRGPHAGRRRPGTRAGLAHGPAAPGERPGDLTDLVADSPHPRSEERRVGKESG